MTRLGFPTDRQLDADTLTAVRAIRCRAAIRRGVPPDDFLAGQSHWTAIDRAAVLRTIKSGVGASDLSDATGQGKGPDSFSPTLRTASVIDFLLEHGATHVPAFTRMLTSGTAAVAAWGTNGKAVRMSKLDLNGDTLPLKRVAGLTVANNESLADSDPRMEDLLGRDLPNAIDRAVNEVALDAFNPGTDGSPAGLGYGRLVLDSAGTSVVNIATDFNAALRELCDLGSDLANVVAIIHGRTAANLATMRTAEGGVPFPGVTPKGGTLFGMPTMTSREVTNVGSPTNTYVVLVDASDVVVTDEGARASVSDETTIEMDSLPTGDSVTPTAATATRVSMFQAEATAIKVVRRMNWTLRRGFIVSVGGVNY